MTTSTGLRGRLTVACTLGSLAVGVLLAGRSQQAAASSSTQPVLVRPHPSERRVDVFVGDAPFTSYVWPERLTKPVLYPVRSAGGAIITRSFPLEPRAGERVDHPHQVGLWFTHGDVNGVDFWNNSEARTPEERAKMGTIRQIAIDEATSGSAGTLRVRHDWVMPDGSVVIRERATYRFAGGPDFRLLDRTTVLSATAKRVVLTDNKEGLLGIRVARALETPSSEPLLFTDANGRPTAVPVLDNAGVSGAYTSSEGLTGDAVWGTRARWVALAGRVGREDVVLLMLDHPANPGYPSHWHARGYGLFAANPLGARVFSNGKERLDLAIEPGASVGFRHRLLIISGTFSAERAESAWKEFAAESQE
jgi:hypothetical protein